MQIESYISFPSLPSAILFMSLIFPVSFLFSQLVLRNKVYLLSAASKQKKKAL